MVIKWTWTVTFDRTVWSENYGPKIWDQNWMESKSDFFEGTYGTFKIDIGPLEIHFDAFESI